MPSQLPFFVAACDYTLIGEEFFAASAYPLRPAGTAGQPEGAGRGQDSWSALVLIIGCVGGDLRPPSITGNEISARTRSIGSRDPRSLPVEEAPTREAHRATHGSPQSVGVLLIIATFVPGTCSDWSEDATTFFGDHRGQWPSSSAAAVF